MTDLLRVLPHFPASQFSRILHALDLHSVTTTDILTLPPADLARRTNLPVLDLRRFGAAVLDALHRDLSVLPRRDRAEVVVRVGETEAGDGTQEGEGAGRAAEVNNVPSVGKSLSTLTQEWTTISTLDEKLDAALGGGIPTRSITEITGESATAKTQFLLTLLLSVQLPPPHGLSRPALYLSTESPLPTRRLSQMLAHHPLLQKARHDPTATPTAAARLGPPSLDNIVSTVTPDLESQDHILQFQVPVEVQRRNIGLIIVDSVAANYRAEFDRATSSHGSNMAARSTELVKLGAHLRDLATRYDLAVVVANQVSDRFSAHRTPIPLPPLGHSLPPPPPPPPSSATMLAPGSTQESPLARRTKPLPSQPTSPPSSTPNHHHHPPSFTPPTAPPALLLDHQQRFFTGWGDSPLTTPEESLKTPSLGLIWTTQIACRIALFRRPVYRPARLGNGHEGGEGHEQQQQQQQDEEEEDGERMVPTQKGWRRWMKVVFAAHAPPSGPGLDGAVEFEVGMGGLRGVGGDDAGG